MANRAAQVGDSGSLSEWYRDVPPITKFFFTGTFLLGAMTSANMLGFIGGPGGLVFDFNMLKDKFQIWRLVTPFIFAGGFGLNFVFHLHILYENCKRYEANPYNTGAGGTSADMFYMIVLGGAVCVIMAIFESSLGFGMTVMSEPILYMIIYVWSRKEPDMQLNMWGVKFKALYLPWVYMAIRVVMGGSPTAILIGIAIGHLFYFLVEVVPIKHGIELVKTPKWCMDFISWASGSSQGNPNVFAPPGRRTQGGIGQAPEGTANAPAGAGAGAGLRNRGGYNWGRGNVLGNQGN
jgi:hypothetical protein